MDFSPGGFFKGEISSQSITGFTKLKFPPARFRDFVKINFDLIDQTMVRSTSTDVMALAINSVASLMCA